MGIKENNVKNAYLLEWQAANPQGRLFRNNYAGGYRVSAPGAYIPRCGIPEGGGGGDLLGYTVKRCCELFGVCPSSPQQPRQAGDCPRSGVCDHFVAVFTSAEVKTALDRVADKQRRWAAMVVEAGGIAHIWREPVATPSEGKARTKKK